MTTEGQLMKAQAEFCEKECRMQLRIAELEYQRKEQAIEIECLKGVIAYHERREAAAIAAHEAKP